MKQLFIFGSLSNVGVMVSREQYTSAEVAKIAKSKGNTFQRFNGCEAFWHRH